MAGGEVLLRQLRSIGKIPPAAVEFLWRRLFDTHATTDEAKAVAAVEAAAVAFVARSPMLRGVAVVRDGEVDILRLLREPGHQVVGVDDEGIVLMRLELVSDVDGSGGGSPDSPVEVRSDGQELVMQVRRDASDAAIRVGVAGALERWLAPVRARPVEARNVPEPAGRADRDKPGEAELTARRLLAELEAVRRLQHGRSRFDRMFRGRVVRRTFHQEVTHRALGRVKDRVRELLKDPDLPGHYVKELRDALRARTSTVRAASTPPNAAGPVLHLGRRVIAATAPIVTTVVTGHQAHRLVDLTVASTASTALGAPAQAWSDVSAARTSRGREGPRRVRLPEPPEEVSRSAFTRPALPGPKANFTKRTPAGLARSAASLTVLAAFTGSPVFGLEGLGLTVLSNVVQAELDHILYHPNRVSAKRHAHEAERTWDHVRNISVDRVYHLMRELVDRQDRLGGRLTPQLQEGLHNTRLLIADMAYGLEAEVRGLMKEMHQLRHSPVSRPRSRRTYNMVERGVTADAPNKATNAMWFSGQYAAAQIPSLALGEMLHSAVHLVQGNFLSAALSGVAYGLGWSTIRPHEVFFRQVVMAWDARSRLHYVAAAVSYLLDRYGDTGANRAAVPAGSGDELGTGRLSPPSRPVPIDATADAGRYRVLQLLRLSSLAEAMAHGRANREAGRPAEVSNWMQIYYKHLPTAVTNAATAAVAGTVLFPLAGPVLAASVVGGFATRMAIGLGENLVRTLAPRYAVFDLKRKLLEAAQMPVTVAEMVEEIGALTAVAAAANSQIRPVDRVPAGLRALPRSLKWRLSRGRRAARRISVRLNDTLHWREPPALSRGPAPAGELRLTRRDRVSVGNVHRLAVELHRAADPRYNARADLDARRIGKEMVVLLDRLGLRTEQDRENRRWSVVTADVRHRYGYSLAGNTALPALRGIRLDHPGQTEDEDVNPVGAEHASRPDQSEDERSARAEEERIHQGLVQALMDARSADPLSGQLWDAVHSVRAGQLRFDVRPRGLIKVFPPAEHRFVMSIRAAVVGPNTWAELRLAPDDLWHAIRGKHRDEPHQLTIDPASLAQPDRLAEVLAWAAGQVAAARGSTAHRSQALLSNRTPGVITMHPAGTPTASEVQPLADSIWTQLTALVNPGTKTTDLPQRLADLADLAGVSAADDAQRANAAVLRAAEMVTRGLSLDDVRNNLVPHRDLIAVDARIAWIEWLDTLGRQHGDWQAGLDQLSRAILPACMNR